MDKLQAIKAVCGMGNAQVLGLKEAKDFIEEVMKIAPYNPEIKTPRQLRVAARVSIREKTYASLASVRAAGEVQADGMTLGEAAHYHKAVEKAGRSLTALLKFLNRADDIDYHD